MTPRQIKTARGLLGWSRDRLAGLCGIPASTMADFEQGQATRAMSADRLAAVRTALEIGGVEFMPENDGGAGVRLKARGAP